MSRVVLIVESENGKDNNALELSRTHFGSNSKDFITAVDENNVIVVKDLSESEAPKEIDKAARALEAYLLKEGVKNVHIAYGTVKSKKSAVLTRKQKWRWMWVRFSLMKEM